MKYQVKKCCDEMPHHMYMLKANNRIDIEADHYFDFEDVKYCLYCGNRTMIELAPDRPAPEPYKPIYQAKREGQSTRRAQR